MILQPGDKAPDFVLPDADMKPVRSEDLFGQGNIVLCFYPRSDTPGCTLTALAFTDLQTEFEAEQTEVIAISRDTCADHGKFRDKHGLTIRLLADIDGEICDAYGVLCTKKINGIPHISVLRSSFIIDRSGHIRYALYDAKPKGHAEHVLDLVQYINAVERTI